MDIQKCTKCGTEKPFTDFYKSKRNRNGIEHRCKDCQRHHGQRLERKNACLYDQGIISNPVTTKLCSKCGLQKPSTEFNKQKSNSDGLQCYCKLCSKESTKHYDRNVRCGISQTDYDWLLQKQEGKCGLCLVTLQTRLHIDHDHSCCHPDTRRTCKNCIRGLLCGDCNRMFLPVAEKFSHLQNSFTSSYLKQRPFIDRPDEIVQRVIEPELVTSPDSDGGIPSTLCSIDSEFMIHRAAE